MKYRLMIFLIFFIAVTGCTAANIETSQPLQPTPTQTLLPTATQQLLPPPTDAPTPTKEENEGVTDPVQ